MDFGFHQVCGITGSEHTGCIRPSAASTDCHNWFSIGDAAAVQSHQSNLNTHFGSLSEHAQGIGNQFHRMYAAKHLGQSSFTATERMGCCYDTNTILLKCGAALLRKAVFSRCFGAIGTADTDNLSGKSCFLCFLHQTQCCVTFAGSNYNVKVSLLCRFQGNVQGLFGVDRACLFKNGHKASSCSLLQCRLFFIRMFKIQKIFLKQSVGFFSKFLLKGKIALEIFSPLFGQDRAATT